jgi:Ataxin-3
VRQASTIVSHRIIFLDTGFFSIQVLQRALQNFAIDLIPYNSQGPSALDAREDPTTVQAYICNLREHWLTIRRFARHYFDLNSMLAYPKVISDTYLSLYLAQLQQNGYSIFLVQGNLPRCDADTKLAERPFNPVQYRQLTDQYEQKRSKAKPIDASSDDSELQRAIKASIEQDTAEDQVLQNVLARSLQEAPHHVETESDNQKLLEQAIAISLAGATAQIASSPDELSADELRRRRLQFFDRKPASNEPNL